MKSIKKIISELKKVGQKVVASKIENVFAARPPLRIEDGVKENSQFVELIPMKQSEITKLTKRLKKPLGLILFDMGLKQAHKSHKVRVPELMKTVDLKEDNLTFFEEHELVVFRKEKPFQILNEYYKLKEKRGEPLVTDPPIFIKKSVFDSLDTDGD